MKLQNRLYTKAQAAKYVGVSIKTLEIWLRDGKMKFYRFPTGAIRIHPYAILEKLGQDTTLR